MTLAIVKPLCGFCEKTSIEGKWGFFEPPFDFLNEFLYDFTEQTN
jgi:hypothetical protein